MLQLPPAQHKVHTNSISLKGGWGIYPVIAVDLNGKQFGEGRTWLILICRVTVS